MKNKAEVRTVKDNNLANFDKICQGLLNTGWTPESDLVVTYIGNGNIIYHRTFILLPIEVQNPDNVDLTHG